MDLKALKEFFENCPNILFVLIFGSYARDKKTPFSDLDLAIYFSTEPELLEIGELITKLEENLIILKNLKESLLPENLKNDVKSQWAIRYGLFECIQIIVDISCHLVSKYNLGNPKSYAECIELLRKYGYISSDLEDKLIIIF